MHLHDWVEEVCRFQTNSRYYIKLRTIYLFLFTTCLNIFLPLTYGQPEGFRKLFNGKNLEGWWGLGTENPETWINLSEKKLSKKRNDSLEDIKKHWRVENEELINDGKGLFLTTIENFADFELRLEYKTVAKADSGIYLRGYPQVQIWDTTEAGGKWKYGAQKGSGGLWNNRPKKGWAPLTHADKAFGDWNHFRIIMEGEIVTVWLNQTLVVDQAPLVNYWNRKNGKKSVIKKGPIQLQTHGGEIRWRNLFIKDLSLI